MLVQVGKKVSIVINGPHKLIMHIYTVFVQILCLLYICQSYSVEKEDKQRFMDG